MGLHGILKVHTYHLRLRSADLFYLAFCAGDVTYIPVCLSLAPWSLTREMRPVVAHLLSRGHRPAFISMTSSVPSRLGTRTSRLRRRIRRKPVGIYLHCSDGLAYGCTRRRQTSRDGVQWRSSASSSTLGARIFYYPWQSRATWRRPRDACWRTLQQVPVRMLRSVVGRGNSTNLAVFDACGSVSRCAVGVGDAGR
jgi:hypothetical protein